MTRVIRTLSWFDKRSEEWMGEARLRGARLAELRRLFNARGSDPMYDSYEVRRRHLVTLKKWVDVPIVLEKYDYFVECSAAPTTSRTLACASK